MAKEMVKRPIDGHDYEFSQMGAKQSLKTLVRLSKIIGKPIAMLAGAPGKGILDKDVSSETLAAAVGAMVEHLDGDETVELCELLCATTVMCDGKKVDFQTHYEGRLDHLFSVLSAALEVQYGNFFQGVIGRRGSLESSPTIQDQQP